MKRGKKAQQIMGISFGVMFSIILIIFFMIIAFIVINSFLNTQKCAQVGLFINDFQTEINKAWNSQKSDFIFKSKLPSSLTYVCIANLTQSASGEYKEIGVEIGVYGGTESNLFLYPFEKACNLERQDIKHLNIGKITSLGNPYCIMIDKGNIDIQIEKGFNEGLVSIE